MPSTTPLLLVDNVFDTIQQYRSGVISASSESADGDPRHVADYRRERTWWEPAVASGTHDISSDVGSGFQASCDFLYLDRGHQNLLGGTVLVQHSSNGSAWTTTRTLTVPATLTAGGDPTSTTMCVTEEGALYSLFTLAGPFRYWRVVPPADVLVRLTGVMLGARNQLVNYSAFFDEDQGSRQMRSEVSDAGYPANGSTYAWRNCEIHLSNVGVSDYDNKMRELRRLLFELNEPAVIAKNYGLNPERAWMFQLEGNTWGMPKERVYRSGKWRFREVGQLLLR